VRQRHKDRELNGDPDHTHPVEHQPTARND